MAKKPLPKKTAKKSKTTKKENKFISKIKKTKIKDKVMFELPHYPQSDEFTSSAASAMMVLKFLNDSFKFKKESEYMIWQESVNGREPPLFPVR